MFDDQTTQGPGNPQPETTSAPSDARKMQLVIDIVDANGRIDAVCLPSMHRFLIDKMPIAGFHAMVALGKAIEQVIAAGPTDV